MKKILSDTTIEELENRINIKEIYVILDYLYAARDNLDDETINDVQQIIEIIHNAVEGYDAEDGDELFDLANKMVSHLNQVQSQIEKVVDMVKTVVKCRPDREGSK
ncbi:MAG: hypothetical protein HON94_10100 [Methylococcales bacterium]|jgi:hypothetical protein|nr:hypothetical protein [Methylococcales bacterium]MBT7410313.1 hypothetical protein [Methylococcales bacterium]